MKPWARPFAAASAAVWLSAAFAGLRPWTGGWLAGELALAAAAVWRLRGRWPSAGAGWERWIAAATALALAARAADQRTVTIAFAGVALGFLLPSATSRGAWWAALAVCTPAGVWVLRRAGLSSEPVMAAASLAGAAIVVRWEP